MGTPNFLVEVTYAGMKSKHKCSAGHLERHMIDTGVNADVSWLSACDLPAQDAF